MSDFYEEVIGCIVSNQGKCYRLAYSYVLNKEAALDVVQNSICVALEKYTAIQNPAAIKTWFYRVVVNEALQYLRKNKHEIVFAPEMMPEGSYEEAFSEGDELYRRVTKLPPKSKTVILLRFYEEMSLKEIAEITGENLNTVKTRLYRALRELGKSIEEEME